MNAFRSTGPSSAPRLPHWRTDALTRTLRTAAKQLAGDRPAALFRKQIARLARLTPPSFAVRRHDTFLGGVPCRWFHPRRPKDGPVLLHLHGGGFCIGSVRDTHDLFISDLARHTGLRSVGVDYRLAPEHPFPIPVDDCVRAFLALVDSGIAPSEIVLTGDSAGGNLALAMVQRLRDAGNPLPLGMVLMSPWVDLELRGETVDRHESHDYISRDVLESFVRNYMQGASIVQPLASPCHADFTGFPPMLVQVGGLEAMLSEIRYLTCRAQSHGVLVEHQEWPGMIHAFQGFGMFLPEAQSAFRAIGHFVDNLGVADSRAGRRPHSAPRVIAAR
jgi:epsilon-lactone hydrolase